jgi:hypothetical protein
MELLLILLYVSICYVRQLKASLDQATAAAERANAQFELAQQNYARQAEPFEKKVIAQATLDTRTRNLEAAKQSLTGARAEEERARLAYSSNEAEVAFDAGPAACSRARYTWCWMRSRPGRSRRRGRSWISARGRRAAGRWPSSISPTKCPATRAHLAPRLRSRSIPSMAPRLSAAQNPAAHVQLAELRLPRGALRICEVPPSLSSAAGGSTRE